jgi:hypothetical protein
MLSITHASRSAGKISTQLPPLFKGIAILQAARVT